MRFCIMYINQRMVDTEIKCGRELNIDKSQIIRVSRSNESLQIQENNREPKGIDHFIYIGSVLTRDSYCTREIKIRIAIAKEAFNRKNHSLQAS